MTEIPCLPRLRREKDAAATLVEVMVAMAVFVVAFAGLFLAYGQAVRMMDSLRRVSRAEDILQSNAEFLRTRSWSQLTNVVVTSSGGTSPWTSNVVESISATSSNSPVCNVLTLLPSDPLKTGLIGATRTLTMANYPGNTASEPMRRITVSLAWTNLGGTAMSNAVTLLITKGGLSADAN